MLEVKIKFPDNTHGIYLWHGNFQSLIYDFQGKIDMGNASVLLNKINNQGISNISLETMTYMWCGKILPLERMGTAEKLFLITYCVCQLGEHLDVVDYPDELSPNAARLYIEVFKDADITVYVKNIFSAFAGVAEECGLCTL